MNKTIYTLVVIDNECHIEGISTWPTLAEAQKELKEDFERTIKDIVGEDNNDFLINVQELTDKSYYISYANDHELFAEIREYEANV